MLFEMNTLKLLILSQIFYVLFKDRQNESWNECTLMRKSGIEMENLKTLEWNLIRQKFNLSFAVWWYGALPEKSEYS